MAGSLRGQLGVKSSPLCPTSAKLCTQYLVLDHMNNHYRKLSKVKPSIDNAPPKSMTKSQKARDRVQRDKGSRPSSHYAARSGSRNTATPYSAADSDIYDETCWGNPEDEEESHVISIMKDILKKPGHQQGCQDVEEQDIYPRTAASGRSNSAMDRTMSWPPQNVRIPRPASANSARSLGATISKPGLQPQPTQKVSDNDIINARSHVFTEPQKPFTPRTLKSNRTSRLSEYKYYTPPKPKKNSSTKKCEEADVDVVDGPPERSKQAAQQPVPKPRQRVASGQSKLDSTQDSENTLTFATLQTRDLSRVQLDKSQMVPPLDISVDKDHMEWIKEQASKARIRTSKGRPEMGSIKEDRLQNHNDTVYHSDKRLDDTRYSSGKRLDKSGTLNTRSFGSNRSWAQDRATAEEEELKYVEFVKDVTRDVLERGIVTNRVLLHAFENHVQKRKHELDEATMRSMLTQLREQLGIPSNTDEAEYDDENMGHSSNRSGKSGRKTRERQYQRETRTTNYKMSNPSITYDGLIPDATATSSWLSEGTGADTLQYGKFGGTNILSGSEYATDTLEYDRVSSSGKHLREDIYEEPSLTTTLDQDGDVLSVTQALKNYELDITQKDSLENHLHRREDNYSDNSVPALENGDRHTVDDTDTLRCPRSDLERAEKTKLSPRPRMRRQIVEDLHDSVGISDRMSQKTKDDDKRSTASGRSHHIYRKKHSEKLEDDELIQGHTIDRVVSPKAVFATRSQVSDLSADRAKVEGGASNHGNPDGGASNHGDPEGAASNHGNPDGASNHGNLDDTDADEDYADDYEDADDEDGNTLTTHRTSDDDF